MTSLLTHLKTSDKSLDQSTYDLILQLFYLYQSLFDNSNPQILQNNDENTPVYSNLYMNIYFSWSNDIFNIIDNFLELYIKIYYRYIDLIKLEKYSCIERILPMFTQFASAQGQVFLKEEYQIQYIKKLFFLYNTFISTNIENTYTEFQCKIFLSLSEIVYKMTNNFHIKLLSSVNEFKSFFNIYLNMVINIWDITRKSIENNNLADFSIYFEYNAECFEYNINSLSHLLVYDVFFKFII